MKEALSIVFLGTPHFAVDSLAILTGNGYHVKAVVTAPDQPAGRGQSLRCSPVKEFALLHGIRVLQPQKLKDPDFISELFSLNADLFIVVAFRMLPEIVWKMPRLGTFNLHASLLPQYRGAAPINRAIMNGETETGITTFFLKQEIDTGEIIFQEKMAIHPDETAGELHDRMMVSGARLVLKTTEAIASGKITRTDQSKLISSTIPLKTAPKIFREDCLIDWSQTNAEIINKVRGLCPYPAAFTHLISPAGEIFPVKIFKVAPATVESKPEPAKLLTDGKSILTVFTADGALKILEIQLAGKKVMKTDEFLRGFRLNTDWKIG